MAHLMEENDKLRKLQNQVKEIEKVKGLFLSSV